MSVAAGQPPRIALGAIFKNEGPYVLEWVAYHLGIGVTRFFIADNDSDDETTALLAGLQALGVVDHIPFPSVPGAPPQLPAYREIIRRHRKDADWIAFIDADEFLAPTRPGVRIRDILSAADQDVGAVVVSWAVFGSSGLSRTEPGLVVQRFTQRAERDYFHNHHYKTIIRSSAVAHPGGNPHHFILKPGFRTIQPNGETLALHPERGPGLSKVIDWSTLRLNHYAVKSRAEFIWKKSPRGSATVATRVKRGGYFQTHDRNEITEVMRDVFVTRTREGVDALKRRLLEIGIDQAVVDADLAIGKLDGADPHGVFEEGRGYVDRSAVARGRLILQGWALDGAGRQIDRLRVHVGRAVFDAKPVARQPRPDVVRHFPDGDPNSGFRLEIPLSELGAEALLSPTAGILAPDQMFEVVIVESARLAPLFQSSLAAFAGVDDLSSLSRDEKRALAERYVAASAETGAGVEAAGGR
jgi:hypothetical protein